MDREISERACGCVARGTLKLLDSRLSESGKIRCVRLHGCWDGVEVGWVDRLPYIGCGRERKLAGYSCGLVAWASAPTACNGHTRLREL